MKRIGATIAAFLFAATLSITAAAENISKSVHVPQTVQISGKTIPAGDYKVKVDTTGSNAQVRFMQGSKEIANVPAQVKTLPNKPYATQVVFNNSNKTLDEIDFGGTTTAVRFSSQNATAGE